MSYYRLPLSINPIITTYLSHAQFLGILAGNMQNQDQWLPWIYNKYINCCFTESPEFKFDVYERDKFFTQDGILNTVNLSIDCESLTNVLKYTEKDFIDMVKNIILGGSYVWGIHNEKYIGIKIYYQKEDHMHGYMLHGFDDDKQAFLCATYGKSDNYYENQKYSEFWIDYSEYYRSVFQLAFPKLSFRSMRFNKNYRFQINLLEIYNGISNYLNSTSNDTISPKDEKMLFGISAWRRLILYLKDAAIIDIRFTKIFKEHHSLMYDRLKYLCKLNIVDKALCEDYYEAVKYSEIAYFLSLKYNLGPSLSVKEHCLSYTSRVIDRDCDILNSVLDKLKNAI